jgi:flagellar basal body-associated protein FliL
LKQIVKDRKVMRLESNDNAANAREESGARRVSHGKARWVVIACLLLCVTLGVVVLVLATSSKMARNQQKAIELVKEHLDGEDPVLRSSMFESWEASGDSSMMEVRATYYPRNIEGFRETHAEDVLHTLKWQVNLNTGSVNLKEDVEPDG